MSGGVDSSVAAGLLREQGHEVIGLFMRHGQDVAPVCVVAEGREKQGCCSAADADDARRVADQLQIPFYAVSFEAEFDRIVDYFVDEYLAGRTPNPCIACNTWLKFGKLFEYADRLEAEFVATGHYARALRDDHGNAGLYCGVDAEKDQSYVLFGIERKRLNRVLFPVGGHTKERIRQLAAQWRLRVADKPDSQEICFVPDQDHARFIRARRGAIDTAGDIVTVAGETVGRHDGLERFTIGQRKGLTIARGRPQYVVRIDPNTRTVVIGDHGDLARRELSASGANWLIPPPEDPLQCSVKIRYRNRPAAATVLPLGPDRFRVALLEPCYGVAPGQAVVCYDGDRVLGGGWIG